MAKKIRISKGGLAAKIAFDEAKHKRGPGGKFADKPGAGNDAPKKVPAGKHSAAIKAQGKTSGIKGDDIIKVHVASNPKKAGSASAADFDKYKDGMTVAGFKLAVGPKAAGHVAHDIKAGFISVHAPGSLPKPKIELTKDEYLASAKTTGVKGTDVIKLHPTAEVGKMVNPKKAGSKSADDFAKYRDEMTVDEFVAAVGDKKTALAHLNHDKGKGFVSIHEPGNLKALRSGDKKAEAAKVEPAKGKDVVADLADDDILVTKTGIQMSVKEWHSANGVGGVGGNHLAKSKNELQESVNNGYWSVKKSAKPDAAPAKKSDLYSDTDVIQSNWGTSATAASWKSNWADQGNPNPHGSLEHNLKSGVMVNLTSPVKVKTLQVADLKPTDQLALKTTTNPYKEGSDEWIKFKAFELNHGSPLSKEKYDATKALSKQQKDAALQKLIDDGHVKLVAPGQTAAVAATKAASPVPIVKMAASPKWEPDDPRWKAANGIQDIGEAKLSSGYSNMAKLEEVYDAAKVRYVHHKESGAVASYTHSGYQSINGDLRAGLPPGKYAKEIDKLLDESPGFAVDTYMYRGVGGSNGKMLNDLPPPPDFVDLGFSSVSFKPTTASGFAGKTSKFGKSGDNATNLFRIRVPKGHPGINVAIGGQSTGKQALESEAEVILPRGTRYRYVAEEHHVTPNGSPIRVVEVEIVNADGSPWSPKKKV